MIWMAYARGGQKEEEKPTAGIAARHMRWWLLIEDESSFVGDGCVDLIVIFIVFLLVLVMIITMMIIMIILTTLMVITIVA